MDHTSFARAAIEALAMWNLPISSIDLDASAPKRFRLRVIVIHEGRELAIEHVFTVFDTEDDVSNHIHNMMKMVSKAMGR